MRAQTTTSVHDERRGDPKTLDVRVDALHHGAMRLLRSPFRLGQFAPAGHVRPC